MILNYDINNESNRVYINKNTNLSILQELGRLSSDKKILFIYDEKIHQSIVKDMVNNLKLSGCNIILKKLAASKINKTTKMNNLFIKRNEHITSVKRF